MFASIRPQSGQKSRRESSRQGPFSALFGRRPADVDALPEIDVAAGLSRVLRTRGARAEDAAAADDPIREALSAIEAALYSIDAIRELIEQACEVVLSAREADDDGGRALLAESYDELRLAIGRAIEEADERAAGLIGRGQRAIDVRLGGKAHYSVTQARLDLSAKGLNLEPPRDAFATFEEIDAVLERLDFALRKADQAAAGFCRDAQFLIGRLSSADAA